MILIALERSIAECVSVTRRPINYFSAELGSENEAEKLHESAEPLAKQIKTYSDFFHVPLLCLFSRKLWTFAHVSLSRSTSCGLEQSNWFKRLPNSEVH